MATLRYVHQMDNDGEDDRAGGAVAKHSVEATTVMTENKETTITAADKARQQHKRQSRWTPTRFATETTKIDGTTEAEPSLLELGMGLTDEAMMKLGSVAAETKDKHGDDEVARVVAELERERVLRRQHQADEARGALEARRQHRAAGGEVRADERARVNLVRRDGTAADDKTDGDGEANVEAGDGLPMTAMLVDGEPQLVKIDSGARYSVAGTDGMGRRVC
ncbi:hypothetical protein PR002_g14362 [Phytophthora rubi]|uniref:Uncharacterized protein n=1 Tax=Phytophthora rubi TaxID=129364 RepID=A0A6A3LDN4_9STRA|nr:hypothetical protein PR002_g14362 [Phytophthora rubi]